MPASHQSSRVHGQGRDEECEVRVYTHEVTERAIDSTNGRVAKGIVKLLLNLLSHTGAGEVLLGGVERRKAKLGASPRNENLVLRHVAGRSMVLRMGDPPRVIGNTEAALVDDESEEWMNSIEDRGRNHMSV